MTNKGRRRSGKRNVEDFMDQVSKDFSGLQFRSIRLAVDLSIRYAKENIGIRIRASRL